MRKTPGKPRTRPKRPAKKERPLKVALVTAGNPEEAVGGAERLNRGLLRALATDGFDVRPVIAPHRESSVEEILQNFAETRNLSLDDFDIVISGKAPTYAATHSNHVIYLVHTVRAFDDMFEGQFPTYWEGLLKQRKQIHDIDFEALHRAKAIFTIGHEVTERLWRYRGLRSQVLHPPLELDNFQTGSYGDYLFIASRLHPWKRIHLSIQALTGSNLDLRLVIAGSGEAEDELRAIAGGDPRIEFRGKVDDQELLELYAGALAVPFTPIREDYGYATLEAFACAKPVITTRDSGEPCRFVEHEKNGLIADPNPPAIREAFARLNANRDLAQRLGESGRTRVQSLQWANVTAALTQAAEGKSPDRDTRTQILVTDMQPITPTIGGGRLRLLGLYHGTGANNPCTYVGTYDWPGESARDQQVSSTLREVLVPLSDQHHRIAADQAKKVGGKTVIDLLFSQTAQHSPKFLDAVREHIASADVVIFSHPWVYPLVKDLLRPYQTVIYDSQNVESYLRAQLFDLNGPEENSVVASVVEDESSICRDADWIFACSHEDALRFHRLYGVPFEKLRLVPNGVMAFDPLISSELTKEEARARLGLPDGLSAIFIGSEYGPNVSAAQFINDELAPEHPEVTFIIAGGVSETIKKAPDNVLLTGRIDDERRALFLKAADFAINPMLAGSGTNIKMFDFMASRLPILTTAIGARGIEDPTNSFMRICEPTIEGFSDGLKLPELDRRRMGAAARRAVEGQFAWEHISKKVGTFCSMRKLTGRTDRPLFSVIVPSYERHTPLTSLMQRLSEQVERDFEVIVIDQSSHEWACKDESFGFALTYFHTSLRGAISARNTGAFLAQGDILAFVDDDCLPDPAWLLNSRDYFRQPEIVGIEGQIESDREGDPEWRPVTNVGFEGIGFMTANLFVRAGSFQKLGGFDQQFDDPHFREDTDFGWRLQALGRVPYARDVRVFHPAQPRGVERESLAIRSMFFEKDALLYRRHPERYRELFFRESQWTHNPFFKDHLYRGFERIGLSSDDIPDWIQKVLA